jgi:hypothetical protein
VISIGDLEWDEKPGRPQAPTRVFSVPLVRPRELAHSTLFEAPSPLPRLTDDERAEEAKRIRDHSRAQRRTERAVRRRVGAA